MASVLGTQILGLVPAARWGWHDARNLPAVAAREEAGCPGHSLPSTPWWLKPLDSELAL